MTSLTDFSFTTSLPVFFLINSSTNELVNWQNWEVGPGRFTLPTGSDLGAKLRRSDDEEFQIFVAEVKGCPRFLNLDLSENRNITDKSIRQLPAFADLRELNLSSCDISNQCIPHLLKLTKLKSLNISYCNRLDATSLISLKNMRHLEYLDLQGIPKINSGIFARLRRDGLNIHR